MKKLTHIDNFLNEANLYKNEANDITKIILYVEAILKTGATGSDEDGPVKKSLQESLTKFEEARQAIWAQLSDLADGKHLPDDEAADAVGYPAPDQMLAMLELDYNMRG